MGHCAVEIMIEFLSGVLLGLQPAEGNIRIVGNNALDVPCIELLKAGHVVDGPDVDDHAQVVGFIYPLRMLFELGIVVVYAAYAVGFHFCGGFISFQVLHGVSGAFSGQFLANIITERDECDAPGLHQIVFPERFEAFFHQMVSDMQVSWSH